MGFGMFKRTRVTGIIGAARSGQDGVRKVTEAQRTGKFIFVFFGFDDGGVVDLWYFLSTQGCGCGRWFSPSVGTRRGVVGAMVQHVHLHWLIVVGWGSAIVGVVCGCWCSCSPVRNLFLLFFSSAPTIEYSTWYLVPGTGY